MKIQRLAAIGLTGVVVLGSGGYAYAQTHDSAPTYRTATATLADVEHLVDLSGTVTASGRRDLSFGSSGTIASVTAKVGQTVASGDVLARLDPTDLQSALVAARANLAKAVAQLETDEDSQTTAVAGSSTGGTQTSTSGGPAGKPSGASTKGNQTSGSGGSSGSDSSTGVSGGTAAALAALKQEQQVVTTAQTAASTAISAATAALATQKSVCATGSTTGTSTGSTDSGTTTSPISSACSDALSTVQADQAVVADKQGALQSALTALAGTLTKATASASGSASADLSAARTSASGAATVVLTSVQTVAATSGATTGGSTGSGTTTTTAGRIATDQAAIDTAKADLTEARIARADAVLTAPVSGKVLEVDVAKGDTTTAGDAVVVLRGAGSTTVTTTISATQVSAVKKGMTAHVTPAGATDSIDGTVTAIGLLPSSSSSTTSYPVTITLASGKALDEGVTASIEVVTGTVSNAVTVPTSAIQALGATRKVVQVITGSTTTSKVVTVGVVGTTRTSILTGLKAGQDVVIADLAAELPTTTTNNGPGGAGGLNGGPGGGTGGFTRPS